MSDEFSNLPYVPTKHRDYVNRFQEEQEIIAQLVAQAQKLAQSVVVLYGSSGYGKSALAVAICHTPTIKQVFAENIYWIKIGNGENSRTLYKQLKRLHSPLSMEIDRTDLKTELKDKQCLVILDGLRKKDDLEVFLEAGVSSHCIWLVTTQNQETVSPSSIEQSYGCQVHRFHIGRMKRNEAFDLLRYGLSEFDKDKLQRLVDRLYEFPLLIALAKKKINEELEFGQSIDQALKSVNEELSEGVNKFDEDKKLSICFYELLEKDDQELFIELSIFPSHVRIPLAVVGRLWNRKQGYEQRLCKKLYRFSLLEKLDLQENIIVCNDFLRKYVLQESKGRVYAAHEKLLRVYENLEETELSKEEKNYLLHYRPYHSKKAVRTIHISQDGISMDSESFPESKRMSEKVIRDQVFISYSHKDTKRLQELTTMLAPLIREQKILAWDDSKIEAGSEWRKEIENALNSAKVAVLMVSPSFLASEFIAERELPQLLKAAKEEGLIVLWVHISPSMYKETEIEIYQAAHDPSQPLSSLNKAKRDQVLVEICKKIQKAFAL